MVDSKFLFMDEIYPVDTLPTPLQYAALTGLLCDSDSQLQLRRQHYRALAVAHPAPANVVPRTPNVHASDLFRSLGAEGDERRIAFMEAVIDAVLSLNVKVTRVGYFRTPEHMAILNTTKGAFGKRVLSTCFLGLIWSLGEIMKESIIWPIMERDTSDDQQEIAFSLMTREADHSIARIPNIEASMSVNFDRLGETLYCNKYSSLASTVDICSYVLHKRFLRVNGEKLSLYAEKTADLGEKLYPAVLTDEIIRMEFG